MYKIEQREDKWWSEVRVDGRLMGEAKGASRMHVGTVVAEEGLREVERLEGRGEWPLVKEVVEEKEDKEEKVVVEKDVVVEKEVKIPVRSGMELIEEEEFFDAVNEFGGGVMVD